MASEVESQPEHHLKRQKHFHQQCSFHKNLNPRLYILRDPLVLKFQESRVHKIRNNLKKTCQKTIWSTCIFNLLNLQFKIFVISIKYHLTLLCIKRKHAHIKSTDPFNNTLKFFNQWVVETVKYTCFFLECLWKS